MNGACKDGVVEAAAAVKSSNDGIGALAVGGSRIYVRSSDGGPTGVAVAVAPVVKTLAELVGRSAKKVCECECSQGIFHTFSGNLLTREVPM